jgi:hypothetical protein
MGEHQTARDLGQDALTRLQRTAGDDDPTTLGTADNLADALRGLGQHEAARELDQDTLTRRRRVLGDNHHDTLDSAAHLAADLHALAETANDGQ